MFLNTVLILFLLLPFCTSRDTITPTLPLKVGDSLSSTKNIFELGFFKPGNSGNWYLGIWYSKIPEKAVVWVANRDNPINDTSSVLTINRDGNLVLYGNNNSNIPLWSTNINPVEATHSITAKLLDTGNLVVVQENDSENPLWQSFDYPTDTYLPSMKLGLNRRTGKKWFLTSWKSKDDPGTGDYLYKIDNTGSPQFFLSKNTTKFWRCDPWPWRTEPSTLTVYVNTYTFVDNEDEMYFSYFPTDPSTIVRMVVAETGTFHFLEWNQENGRWDEVWAAPKYRCDTYGECGINSKCSPDNINQFECQCLPGFEPKSPNDWDNRNGKDGCIRKHVRSSSMLCPNGEGFSTVAHVKPPDTSKAALWWETRVSGKECEEACLRNCSCTAFMNIEGNGGKRGCFTWYGELIDIMEYTDSGLDLHVRDDSIYLAENSSKRKGFLRKRGMLAVLLSVMFSLLLSLAFGYWWFKKKKIKYEQEKNRGDPDLPNFHLSTITAATNNFSPTNKLGEGGFGSVHKGQLSNGQKIAVKRLSKSSGQGLEELKNEIILIAKLQHRNLVKLLGCCIEGEEKILIYEYMPNKSLDSFIFDQTRRSLLDWSTRFSIIIGVARGVLYLHQDSRLRIIHRDLKASNVLLDAEMNPKISDFGMARTVSEEQIQDKTNRIVGTYGYMPPEYAIFGKFSTKSDVFSFGVILLETVSGMKNQDCYQEGTSISLIELVWKQWKEERALEIVDSLLQSYVRDEVLRCIQIGLLCVQEDVKDRPAMSVIVLMLSSEIVLPTPKQPAYVFRSSFEDIDPQIEGQGLCSTNQLTITRVIAR